ncbi:MAG: hypothetical protein M1833_005378 [Piccolia ochrophora]|nr:MAG: hypothetical protein M1833_005378 [Piccolia ochrophora]
MIAFTAINGSRLFTALTCRRSPALRYCKSAIAFPQCRWRPFHSSTPLLVLKPFLLADIGEGIRECEVIQWFVEPEARVEQFQKLCEVQSDKASVEITSRFDGVIKKLHYEAGDMAIVGKASSSITKCLAREELTVSPGKPLVDIDIQSEISPEDEALTTPPKDEHSEDPPSQASPPRPSQPEATPRSEPTTAAHQPQSDVGSNPTASHSTLATPAVRHLTKELNVDISQVRGTGKAGRVLKEDVHAHASAQKSSTPSPSPVASTSPTATSAPLTEETRVPLNPNQTQMFKTMTATLTIPHFLYADEYNLSPLLALRRKLAADLPSSAPDKPPSILPFIIKAVSMSLHSFPLLNARLVIPRFPNPTEPPATPKSDKDATKPYLIHRTTHNIGVAMSTSSGLLVPTLKSVNTKPISEIAADLAALTTRARSGALTPADLAGATFTVSNIGSIGGTYTAPLIAGAGEQVAIVGIGRARATPAFDDQGAIVKKDVSAFSWVADHRVVDGATVARMAEMVRRYVEEPERMLVWLR